MGYGVDLELEFKLITNVHEGPCKGATCELIVESIIEKVLMPDSMTIAHRWLVDDEIMTNTYDFRWLEMIHNKSSAAAESACSNPCEWYVKHYRNKILQSALVLRSDYMEPVDSIVKDIDDLISGALMPVATIQSVVLASPEMPETHNQDRRRQSWIRRTFICAG